MKILVFSDSHGNVNHMVQAAALENPRLIFHLGDGWRDAERLQSRFPDIPLEQVPGNCDFRSSEPSELLLNIEGFRILLCHGHKYGVKQSLIGAGLAAEELNLDLFLFGHTHKPLVDRRGKTWFLNPGSIGDRAAPSYGILILEKDRINPRTVLLPQ
ncbi:MAG: metallophosphoesterase [Oscillibacter sp.]|nr:metallophosphoesterase [Oscillibacter sp.]